MLISPINPDNQHTTVFIIMKIYKKKYIYEKKKFWYGLSNGHDEQITADIGKTI